MPDRRWPSIEVTGQGCCVELEMAHFVGLNSSEDACECRVAYAVGKHGIEPIRHELRDEQDEDLGTQTEGTTSELKHAVGPVRIEHLDIELVADKGEQSCMFLFLFDEEAKRLDVVVVTNFSGHLQQVRASSGLADLKGR